MTKLSSKNKQAHSEFYSYDKENNIWVCDFCGQIMDSLVDPRDLDFVLCPCSLNEAKPKIYCKTHHVGYYTNCGVCVSELMLEAILETNRLLTAHLLRFPVEIVAKPIPPQY